VVHVKSVSEAESVVGGRVYVVFCGVAAWADDDDEPRLNHERRFELDIAAVPMFDVAVSGGCKRTGYSEGAEDVKAAAQSAARGRAKR
jgi:hypothetical protein